MVQNISASLNCTQNEYSPQQNLPSATQHLKPHHAVSDFPATYQVVFKLFQPFVPGHPEYFPSFYLNSPQQYLWVKEGSEPPLKMTQERALIFPFLNKSDSGTYGCTATSNMGSYTAYFTLNVNGESLRLLSSNISLRWPSLALWMATTSP